MREDEAAASGGAVAVKEGRRKGGVRFILRGAGGIVVGLVVLGLVVWCTLAIFYAGLHGAGPRWGMAIAFVAAVAAAMVWVRPRWRLFAVMACMFALVIIWFFELQPSNDLDWVTDVSRVASVNVKQDLITVRNVRDFDYGVDGSFTPRWVDETYDLAKLRTVDFYLSHWGSKAIAHVMVSFGFEGDRYLAVSIEARYEKAETYSALQSFFRQFELIYVFAEERDVVRLRTNFRKEQVFLYRTDATAAQARELLLSYIKAANSLARQAEFYNGLTSNCATNVLERVCENEKSATMSWEILLSGYAARAAYRNGRLDSRLPFAELEARGNIDAAAQAAEGSGSEVGDEDFSRRIRVGVPSPFMETVPEVR